MVVFPCQDSLESFDTLLQRHKLSCLSCEDFSHLEGLRQKSLDLSGSRYCHLVFFRQLIHTQDGNDILQRLVVLEDLLYTSSNSVMFGAHDVGVHDSRRGVERIDRGVDS